MIKQGKNCKKDDKIKVGFDEENNDSGLLPIRKELQGLSSVTMTMRKCPNAWAWEDLKNILHPT